MQYVFQKIILSASIFFRLSENYICSSLVCKYDITLPKQMERATFAKVSKEHSPKNNDLHKTQEAIRRTAPLDSYFRYFSLVAIPPRMWRSALLISRISLTCRYNPLSHRFSR